MDRVLILRKESVTMAKKAKKTTASNSSKPPTKGQIYGSIAEKTELSRKQVAAVFDELSTLAKKSLRSAAGAFAVPGLCKMVVKKRPATKARKGINPFTGQEQMFQAKPARKTVRIRPLKSVKDMV
jgi:nucleoid DNA-binding protein